MTKEESRLRCLVEDKGWTFGDEERAAVVWALKVMDSFIVERDETNQRIAEVCRENRQIKQSVVEAVAKLNAMI